MSSAGCRYPLPWRTGNPCSTSRRRTALLILLLAAIRLTTSPGHWLLTAILGTLLGESAVLLPFLMRQLPLPAELRRHKAAVWLGIVAALLFALLGWTSHLSGSDNFFTFDVPLTLICLALPMALLLCLRYLPVNRYYRASLSCLAAALWVWVAPWGVDRVMLADGWQASNHYELLHPYSVDFSDWVSAPTAGGQRDGAHPGGAAGGGGGFGAPGRFLPRDKS